MQVFQLNINLFFQKILLTKLLILIIYININSSF